MEIIDLTPQYESTFLACLKDWYPGNELQRGRERKCLWMSRMKDKSLRIKLAINDNEQAAGMIQYLPVEYTRVLGKDLYYIQCIWVHGYVEGMGNQQNQGTGTALLSAAEEDAQVKGAKGMTAWELVSPEDAQASWYQKNGYVRVDRINYDVLVWKPFTGDVPAPRWLRPRKIPQPIPGQVTVTVFVNPWCPELVDTHMSQQIADKMGEKVIVRQVDTSNPTLLREWRIESALYINDECIYTGLTDHPPPGEADIRRKIQEHLHRLY